MKRYNVDSTIGGWFVGNFEKAAYQTKDFEVALKKHYKDEPYGKHYHEHVTEINLVVSGEIMVHNEVFGPGEIFILYPYEVADPKFITDCEIICVKHPGITNDKINL